jgi:sugar phosphate isomerase/epimerase
MAEKASRIGVVLESFHRPSKAALCLAGQMGLGAVEVSATRGELQPERLSRTGRRHLARFVDGLGLQLAGLGASDPGGLWADPSDVERQLDLTRRIMELASELRVPLVTISLGRLERSAPDKPLPGEVVGYLADICDRTGVRIAIETFGAEPQALRALLERAGNPMLGVCYDPGALVMEGSDVLSAGAVLGDRLTLARFSDGVSGVGGRGGYETALGQGQVDLAAYFGFLASTDYGGPLIIRRLHAADPVSEIKQARARLEALLQ